MVRALDDLDLDPATGALQTILEQGALIAAVGVELDQKRVTAEQPAHQQKSAVAVLDVGGMDDRLHQQTEGIDKDMPLLAFDLLACIKAGRINRAPPFSALFTL